MKTAVIYARYSSDSQTEQSIEGQLRTCQQYADSNGLMIVDTYIDRAMTGTNDLRPAFQKMLKDSSKKQFSVVLVYKLDRFSRDKYESTIHKKTLKDHGVKLISAMENIPDSPEGIILESLLEGMNQYYSAELSQKVKRGLKESYIKGNATGGGLLFGYDVLNKKYVINENEGQIIKEIFTKYSEGYTAVALAHDLQARGIRRKNGKYLDVKQLYKILNNSRYTGKVKYGSAVYDNILPSLISDELWFKVEQIHESNRHAPGRKKDILDFILSGKLVCGICKHLMVGESGTSSTKAKHYYYSCISKRRKKTDYCNCKSVKKHILEDKIIQTTWAMLSNNEVIKKIANSIYKIHENESTNNLTLKVLETEKLNAQKAAENLIKALEAGIITEQTKLRLKELETQIASLDIDIMREQQRCYTQLTPQMIENYLSSIIYDKEDCIETRKAIVKSFIKEIILYPNKIIITYNFIDTYEKHEITNAVIQDVEKQAENQSALPLFFSSNILETFPPIRAIRIFRVAYFVRRVNMFDYRMASELDLIKIWDKDIKTHPQDLRYIKWKDEYINNNKQNKCKTFVVSKDDDVIGQITVIFSEECSAVKNRVLICNGKYVANMNAFRIEKQYEGAGHISKIVKLAEEYAKSQKVKYLTIGCEATETRNLSIYFHWGYNEFVAHEIDEEENNTLVLYYRKRLN